MTAHIIPCNDPQRLKDYIHEYWRPNHVLAKSDDMFAFTYMTPWVDKSVFPDGVSVLTIMDDDRMLGFLGAIVTDYPAPRSFWLALWHVLPELKGTGLGGKLLKEMQNIALGPNRDGWIGTFGAGPEAMPVYLKRGYAARAGRRWIFDPSIFDDPTKVDRIGWPCTPLAQGESRPSRAWFDHRYTNHPIYNYDITDGGNVFRTEHNEWGTVTHAVSLSDEHTAEVTARFHQDQKQSDGNYLMDAWAFECPGPGWSLAPEDLPSVFHPPQARGSTTYAVGLPYLPSRIHKGDCDQDRPNEL